MSEHRMRGNLPRQLNPDVLWTGGCLDVYLGAEEKVHSHFSSYVVRGAKKCLLVDTGHPLHGPAMETAIDNFLGDRPIDYIFPTHAEFPHAGLLPKWLEKYPGAKLIGNMSDYDLYYPEFTSRFCHVEPGDAVDLGERQFRFVPAVWRDLPNTLWGFDTKDRILFVSDGFSFLHAHGDHQCAFTTSEQPDPDHRLVRIVNQGALQWLKYLAAERTFDDIDALLHLLRPTIIAPAHGAVIDSPETTLPLIKSGMLA